MTRAEDVKAAGELGASYVGVIFAGGPRHRTLEQAQGILAKAPRMTRRVAVVSDQSPIEIAGLVNALRLDVVQVHADPSPRRIADIRSAVTAKLWAVIRVAGDRLPDLFDEVAPLVDGIVLDAKAPTGLGGSGLQLPWRQLQADLDLRREGTRIILAGGLQPQNVSDAIAALAPDIVDVSSGVESAPGIKNHGRMRAFRDAVSAAGVKQ